MFRILKSLAAIVVWWLCYLPLNALIFTIFLKHLLKGRQEGDSGSLAYDSDDQRIAAWAERNLAASLDKKGDEGFGTRFERHMMAKLLQDLVQRHDITSVLESPADGVTGVPGANSLPLADMVKKPVALANPSQALLDSARQTWESRKLGTKASFHRAGIATLPFSGGEYDLGWSFCMLERLDDPAAYIRETARVSGRAVVFVTLNRSNHGTWFHQAYHKARGMEWDHGRLELMDFSGLSGALKEAGLKVSEQGTVDVPPTWDTWDMPLEIGKITGMFGRKWEWKMDQDAGSKGLMLGLFEWLEDNLPDWFKARHAHHLYVVARTANSRP
jgi:SAM-dependent methyltransferase